jgi:hypothetical protein
MEKEFIPYEQALALKELGFDEPCFAYYLAGGIRFKEYKDSQNKNSAFYNNTVCSIRLYQQAFRWLLVLANKDEHFSNKWTIKYNEDYYSLFLGGCNMGVFKAELECLVKLIEIVKAK